MNNALLQDITDGSFCTRAYATLNLGARPIVMDLTVAGYPQP